MTTTHWTEQPANDIDLARAFLWKLPTLSDLKRKSSIGKEYASRAQDQESFWAALADYVGSAEVARIRA